MKKRTKVEFVVIYRPALTSIAKKVEELMVKCDLGITGIEKAPVTENWSWTTLEVVNEKYIEKAKKRIKEFFKQKVRTGELISIKYLL